MAMLNNQMVLIQYPYDILVVSPYMLASLKMSGIPATRRSGGRHRAGCLCQRHHVATWRKTEEGLGELLPSS